MRGIIRIAGTALIVGIALTLLFALLSSRVGQAASLTVNTLVDESDGDCGGSGNPGTDGDCSLRDAIAYANANSGADSITFNTGGVITITLGSLTISDDGTTIDGDLDNDGTPDVEIRYSSGSVGTNTGLLIIQSSNNRIEGLSITGSPENGILVNGNGTQANDNQIVNNWIGLDLSGASRSNAKRGIYIYHVSGPGSGAVGNVVQGNILSGNGSNGLRVFDALGTRVLSNTIGLDATGTITRSNGSSGIALFGAVTTTIQGNLISSNGLHGIYLTGTQQVTIVNNIIGLNAAGNAARGNQGTGGIYAHANVVGLTIQGNTVSSNRYNGIYLGPNTTQAVIVGNKIGTDLTGTVGLGNGRTTNRDGIQMVNAYTNTIGGPNASDRNIIAHNGRAGIFISGTQALHNVIQNNYIGTGVNGSEDLGNGDLGSLSDTGAGGLYLYDGAGYNVIQDNRIRFNYIGLRFSGGSGTSLVTPPQHNLVLTNTVTSNDKYGIVNQTTHRNSAPYTTPASGDNLIQGNVITGTGQGCTYAWCTGIGVFNYGGSPRLVSNTIAQNKDFGIVNRVYFGTDGPDNAADDLLSMPYIAGNTISGNGNDGIQSRDTAPLNKATLLQDNTFGNNSGEPHISQRWFVAVEVVSGTQTLTSGLMVTITRQDGGQACPSGPCVGSSFASAGGSDGIWGPTGISYGNVENESDGTTTWFEVIEYEVDWQGNWVTYTSHLVQVGGAQLGSRYFDFDGITTTTEVSGEVNLPFCRATGILSDPTQTLCRYQIAQVNVFAASSDGDYDNDGIPDDVEGTGDSDGDGTPDYRDSDSDNDGIPDADERICSTGVGSGDPCDSDGDGTPDYRDSDSDNDGIPDSVEGTGDSDGDGIPNYRDTDSDGDGIPDADERTCSTGVGSGDPCDSDGDGTPDYQDADSDNDGVADSAEGSGDTDGDGVPNYRDTDSDNDGVPDDQDTDDDNDGIPDTEEGLVDNPGTGNDSSVDSDGDGLPDYLDADSDNDGVPDWAEAGCTTAPTGGATCPHPDQDTDGDGTPDRLDTDSDGDGTPDGDEWYDGTSGDEFCSNTTVDSDGDGIPNCQDNDVDGDGIPNFQDPDSDGDGVPDTDESHTDPEPPPFGHDGLPAWLDPVRHIFLPIVTRNQG